MTRAMTLLKRLLSFPNIWIFCRTAKTMVKTRMNASRSSTSLTVWAKRKIVQSRWYVL